MRRGGLFRGFLLLLACALVAGGCTRRAVVYGYPPAGAAQGGPYVAAGYGAAGAGYEEPYTLDSGDRLRLQVFGQDGISNSYLVDASGHVNVALIGPVRARGLTTQLLAQAIAQRLQQGYVREPHVGVEIESYRPFFILGEVNAPGQYPYQPNMTAETAIAVAGGYSPRADKRAVTITRNLGGAPARIKVAPATALRPGDTVNVAERWF